jgi:hypothetical protein
VKGREIEGIVEFEERSGRNNTKTPLHSTTPPLILIPVNFSAHPPP